MSATTIILKGGDLGLERMMVRCDLTRAEAPVEVDYCEGYGWQPTQWQCASTCHRTSGLADIGMGLAAAAVQMDRDDFDCDWSELVQPDSDDAIRKAVALEDGADTSHESAEDWYQSYGWHLSTEDAGDVCLQAVEYDWLDDDDDAAVAAKLEAEDGDLSADEALAIVKMARSVRESAEDICGSLDEAVEACRRGRLQQCRDALAYAYRRESEHGDTPASLGLAAKLLLCDEDDQ